MAPASLPGTIAQQGEAGDHRQGRRRHGGGGDPTVDENETVRRRNLPHLQLPESAYMVTWRLRAGAAPLADEERELVAKALLHFDGDRYVLSAWVVMPDHVHAIALPLPPHTLSQILHTWKSFTANRLQRLFARTGSVWQDESYDHLIRDQRDYEQKARYVLENPLRRWPDEEGYRFVGVGSMED